MLADLRAADEIPGSGLESIPDAVLSSGRPTVLRGAIREWPFVRASIHPDEAAVQYINRFCSGAPVQALRPKFSELSCPAVVGSARQSSAGDSINVPAMLSLPQR